MRQVPALTSWCGRSTWGELSRCRILSLILFQGTGNECCCVGVLMGLLVVKTSIASSAILSPFLQETLKPLSSAAVMGQLARSTNRGLWIAKEMGMWRRRKRRQRLLGRHDTPVGFPECHHPKVSSRIFFQAVTRISCPRMFSHARAT